MTKTPTGVGYFTAETIAAILQALPETNDTHAEVAKRAREYGVTVSAKTISRWTILGRADITAGKSSTAYARFATHYDRLKAEHCTPNAMRNRQFDRAMTILERTCDCGSQKAISPDGTIANTCRGCEEIESHGLSRPNARSRDRPLPTKATER